MATNRDALGESLCAGRAHIVGVDIVEQQRALQEVRRGIPDQRHRERREDESVQRVEHNLPPVIESDAGRPRHVEDARADDIVEPDRDEDEPEGGDDRGNVHRDGRREVPDAVCHLVLPVGGVHAERDASDGRDDRGARDELRRDPHSVGHLTVDATARGGDPPVPAEEDAREPGPPAFEQRHRVTEVSRFEECGDLVRGQRRTPTDVIAAWIHEVPREEVRDVGRHHDDHQPRNDAASQISEQGVSWLSQRSTG